MEAGRGPWKPYGRIVLACAVCLAATDLLVLTGWLSGFHSIASWASGYKPMSPSAALLQLVFSLCLFLYLMRLGRRPRMAIAAVLMLEARPGGRAGRRSSCLPILIT